MQVQDLLEIARDLASIKKEEYENTIGAGIIASQEIGLSEKFNLLTRNIKKETKSVYISEINHFLRFSHQKEIPDKWDLRRFFSYLDKNGFSRSYQRNAWYALKIYFKAKELSWPLDKSDYPKLDKSEIKKVTLSKAQVIQMIEVTKLIGTSAEKMLLALASTYGLRRAEICALTENDIDREKHTLFIHTKKGGEKRYHLIPEEIKPYIYSWNFNKRISTTEASLIFDAILFKSGIEKTERMGIHSLRRSLATELSSTDLPPLRIYGFLRWKKRDIGMLAEYDNPDFRKVDEIIFTRHPFLKYFD